MPLRQRWRQGRPVGLCARAHASTEPVCASTPCACTICPQFADRARAIANNPVVNTARDVGSILALKEKEIQRLRMLLATYMQQQEQQQQQQQGSTGRLSQLPSIPGLDPTGSEELASTRDAGQLPPGTEMLVGNGC